MFDYDAYAVRIRREIHMHPEIGFDLTNTLSILRRELTEMGIPFTEAFGRSSIVATLNGEKSGFTIGIRADMDALPIEEENDVPYRSAIPGRMHACGHDVHTAILLATAKRLNDEKRNLRCRVKFLFTPAEEYTTPGCKLMAEDGVMDDIDCIVALHVETKMPAGTVGITAGGQNGNSHGFTVEMFGESAHAARQYLGKDAIMMCIKAYNAMEMMVAKEVSATEPCLLNIGAFNGGITNNIVCNHCTMFGTLRSWNDEVDAYVFRRINEIAESVAAESHGRTEVKTAKFLPYVSNDPAVTERMRQSAVRLLGEANVLENERTLGGEDFSFLSRRKPGMMFRLGVRNEALGCTYGVHTTRFNADESCVGVGIGLFTQFVLDNMDGIAF